jgi:hypothetical protein
VSKRKRPAPPPETPLPADPIDDIRPLTPSEMEFLKGGAQPGPSDPAEIERGPKRR